MIGDDCLFLMGRTSFWKLDDSLSILGNGLCGWASGTRRGGMKAIRGDSDGDLK
jgi:hypothetical protein